MRIDEDLTTDKITLEREVRQGDTVSSKSFTLALEDVFKELNWESIDESYLDNLRFADDVVFISRYVSELKSMLQQLNTASCRIGLKMNYKQQKS